MNCKARFEIVLNGDPFETESRNLTDLLEELDKSDDLLATALNGEFVPKHERHTKQLQNGDQVELVAPMAGG